MINRIAEKNGANAAAMRREEYGAKLAIKSEEVALKEKEMARKKAETTRTRGRKRNDKVAEDVLPEAAAPNIEGVTESRKKVSR